MYLSVIIPAYNEEKRIGKTLDVVYTYLTRQPFDWELLIVLDGSTDNTITIIEQFAQGKEHIRWIDRQQNRGKGYTVREGMLAAQGEIRLFTDADNSTDISHFDKMKPLFQQGQDVVIGSRDSKDAKGARQAIPQSFAKRFMGNMGNLFIQVMAVPGIWDTQCGFKAFRASVAQKVFSATLIDGWGFDIEALALARKYGHTISVIGTHWVDEDGSHVQPSDYVKTFFEAMKVRWYLLSGAYK